jgi:hypothetical protein
MINLLEAFFDVSSQRILGLELDVVEDGFDSILGKAPWPEPVAVGFKGGFPFWFEGQFDQGLFSPVLHDGYARGLRSFGLLVFGM